MIYLIILLVLSFVIYVILTKRRIRQLTEMNIALQQAGNKILFEYHNLTEQYRLLSKVQEVLKRPTKSKK